MLSLKKIISFVKSLLLAPFVLYSFNVMGSIVDCYIPINLITVFVVGILGIPGLITLVIFMVFIF